MRSLKSFFITTLCVAALAAPIATLADTNVSDSTQTNSTTNQPAGATGHHHGMFGMLRNLNLTQQQQDQIKTIKDNFHKTYPEGGTKPDAAARQALRDQILGVLTPDQRTKLQTEMQNWKAQHPEVAPTTKP